MISALPTSYDAFFSDPPLIHPTVHFRLHKPASSPHNDDGPDPLDCALHMTLYLNDRLFVDPYELGDRWGPSRTASGQDMGDFDAQDPDTAIANDQRNMNTGTESPSSVLGEQGAEHVTPSIRWKLEPPVPDLERPVRYQFVRRIQAAKETYHPRHSLAGEYALQQTPEDGSEYPFEAVLHIAQHAYRSSGGVYASFDLDIPTHMRYQEPSSSKHGYRQVLLGDVRSTEREEDPPEDVLLDVSWSCRSFASSGGGSLLGNDRNRTTTYLQLLPPSAGQPHSIALPTAIASHAAFVPPVTFVVVVLSWLYIVRALLRLWTRAKTPVQGGKTTSHRS